MTSTDPRPDIIESRSGEPVADALLLQAVRDGSDGAFGILYERHRSHAVTLAASALPRSDGSLAEDVAEVSLLRIFTALRNGKGPSDTVRFYLATTVRREAWRAQRRRRRQGELLDRWAADERSVHGVEPVVETDPDSVIGSDEPLRSHDLLAEAFQDLPERWRNVLWLTEVEGRKPAEVAPLLGLTAGSAAALAYRARRGLIAAYVRAYRQHGADPECDAIADRLSEYVASGRPAEGFDDVTAHLEGCSSCRDLIRGIDVVGGSLRGVLPVAVLSTGLWAAKGATATGAVKLGAVAVAGAAHHGVAGAATSTASGAGAGGAGGAAGGIATGWVAAVAACVVVVAVAVGAVASFGRSEDPGRAREQASGASPTGSVPRPRGGSGATGSAVEGTTVTQDLPRPNPDQAPPPAEPVTETSAPAGPPAAPEVPPGRSAPSGSPQVVRPARPVSPTAPSTTAPAPTTSLPPATSTTRPSTTTTSPTTTSTTAPPAATADLSGRIVQSGTGDGTDPVAGILVEAIDGDGDVVAFTWTGVNGSWVLDDVPTGSYRVVAFVPAWLRPAVGPDPWTGGLVWMAELGQIQVAGAPVDLVDLVLAAR